MVSPRTLAVLRLMTSSNLVGCSTGRSAGFSPWKDLVHVDTKAPEAVRFVQVIGEETPGLDITLVLVHGGQPTLGGEVDEPLSVDPPKWIRLQEECLRPCRGHRGKGPCELLGRPDIMQQ